jgi:hypothetical protein
MGAGGAGNGVEGSKVIWPDALSFGLRRRWSYGGGYGGWSTVLVFGQVRFCEAHVAVESDVAATPRDPAWMGGRMWFSVDEADLGKCAVRVFFTRFYASLAVVEWVQIFHNISTGM